MVWEYPNLHVVARLGQFTCNTEEFPDKSMPAYQAFVRVKYTCIVTVIGVEIIYKVEMLLKVNTLYYLLQFNTITSQGDYRMIFTESM